MIRYPKPLLPGDKIAVTSPSAGASGAGSERVSFCVQWLRDQGYEVVVGQCMDGSRITSAPAHERAAELTAMLCDPDIRCVLPPWGGETAIDLVDLLDWDALAVAEPTWLVGYSDLSTILLPITLRLGWATIHGDSLADTPYRTPAGLASWLALASSRGPHVQTDSGVVGDWWRMSEDPHATEWKTLGSGHWHVWGADAVSASGRLIGGCIETLSNLAGTPYGDVASFGAERADDGLIVYLEAAGEEAATICRSLHGMRLSGWFDHASAILIGRTNAPDNPNMTQEEAVVDALGRLGLPIVFDVEIGHVPPHLPLVNGALATVVVDGRDRKITQDLR